MISLKAVLRISGIVLIALGIAVCVGLIAAQYLHCVNVWNTTYKAQEFASALEYFFEVSTGAILIAVVGGSIPVIVGIRLFIKAVN